MRQFALLEGIDLASCEGLEIGPLSRPILRRPEARVYYVDHLGTAGLRAKYAGDAKVAQDDIVPVHIVWGAGALRDAVQAALPGARKWFQYVIASHVIEHVPDVVWWLAELRSVMSSGGALRLLVPDRRFTMDIARRETVLADVLAAYIGQHRRPQPREIIDFYGNFQKLRAADAWAGVIPPPDGASLENTSTGLEHAFRALAGGYEDVHCTVWTPRSFAGVMCRLAGLGMIWFRCALIETTPRGELDFMVHMVAADDRAAILASWEKAEADLAAKADALPLLPQDDAVSLRRLVRQASGWRGLLRRR